ncbi:hypothetical protein GF322_02865 [Candidatus Dependentiae bacterium]|nr:hypothetical protein [Candidatus Dependentiae bacterium]
MKYYLNIFIFLLLFPFIFVACLKRTNFKKEFSDLDMYSKKLTNYELELKTDEQLLDNIKTMTLDKLSLKNAIGIALKNNIFLQASFEDLGVAKSDLEYAGLYDSNPHVGAIVRFPNKKHAKTVFELEGEIPISSYWQIPFKRKIFKDELIIITWGITSLILDITRDVKKTYAKCFFESEIIGVYEKIIQVLLELIKRTKIRKNYGLETNKSIYLIKEQYVRFLEEKNKKINNLNNFVLNLKKLLGINLAYNKITFETNLKYISCLNFDKDLLMHFMQAYNPDIYLANQMISKYQNILKLEQSKFIKEFNLGFSYKREADGLREFGPLLSMDIPFFDTNNAEINKVKFLIQKLRKSYLDQKEEIKQNLLISFNNFIYFSNLKDTYLKHLIPLKNKIKKFTLKYFEKMQLTRIEDLQAQLNLYLTEIEYLDTCKEKFMFLADIERNAGKNLCI